MTIQRLPGEQPLFSDLYLTPNNQQPQQPSLFEPIRRGIALPEIAPYVCHVCGAPVGGQPFVECRCY